MIRAKHNWSKVPFAPCPTPPPEPHLDAVVAEHVIARPLVGSCRGLPADRALVVGHLDSRAGNGAWQNAGKLPRDDVFHFAHVDQR